MFIHEEPKITHELPAEEKRGRFHLPAFAIGFLTAVSVLILPPLVLMILPDDVGISIITIATLFLLLIYGPGLLIVKLFAAEIEPGCMIDCFEKGIGQGIDLLPHALISSAIFWGLLVGIIVILVRRRKRKKSR